MNIIVGANFGSTYPTERGLTGVVIKAENMYPGDEATEKADLSVFTAKLNVAMKEEPFDELVRCMKKRPPSALEYSLVYVGYLDHQHFRKQADLPRKDWERT